MLLFPTTLILLFPASHGLIDDESVIEREGFRPSKYCVDGPFWDTLGLKKDWEKFEWCWNHCNEGQDDDYCYEGLCEKVKLCNYAPWEWQIGCTKSCGGGNRMGRKKRIPNRHSFGTIGCHIDRSMEDRDNGQPIQDNDPRRAEGYSESVNGKGEWTYEELMKNGIQRFIQKCRSEITYHVPCGYGPCPIPCSDDTDCNDPTPHCYAYQGVCTVEPKVNCGSHMEHHCSVCPLGSKGDEGCNGECEWQNSTCVQRKECIGKETLKDVFPRICEDMSKSNEDQFRRYCEYKQIVLDGKTFRQLCEKTCLAC